MSDGYRADQRGTPLGAAGNTFRELISLRDVTVRKCKSVRGGFKTLMNASSQWAGREAAGKRWKTTPRLIASRVKPFP